MTDAGAYKVFGMDHSYFSRKLQAAMGWYGLPFEFVAKTMALAPDIEREAGTRQIPVLLTPDGEHLADTTPVMRMLDERVPDRRMFPDGALGVLVHVVEEWFDEWIARTALHYRWNYPESAKVASAGMGEQAAPGVDPAMQAMVGGGIAKWGAKACRAVGVSEEHQQEAAEAEFNRILAAADAQLSQSKFLLGDRPCAVDAVVLGGLRAHFDMDPDPRKVVDEYPAVRQWLDAGTAWDGTGDLAPFPESTPFARFVLDEFRGAYKTVLLANAEGVAAEQKAFIATLGDHDVSFRTRPYPIQSRQMVCDRIAALDDPTRTRVTAWLADHELDACFP